LARLNQLTTEQETFQSIDGGAIEDMALREKMLSNFMASQTLTLRLGAQVMLIKNVDEMLVNGSMGKVLRFIDPSTLDEREIAAAGDRDAVKNASYLFGKRYPVVEFDLPNGMKRRMLVMPETWKTELPSGEIQVSRTQVYLPL
jgi:ATP-dependent DNA helicase PIF1